jgi:hypothetical protein
MSTEIKRELKRTLIGYACKEFNDFLDTHKAQSLRDHGRRLEAEASLRDLRLAVELMDRHAEEPQTVFEGWWMLCVLVSDHEDEETINAIFDGCRNEEEEIAMEQAKATAREEDHGFDCYCAGCM